MFSGDSKIRMASNNDRNISSIVVGDLIMNKFNKIVKVIAVLPLSQLEVDGRWGNGRRQTDDLRNQCIAVGIWVRVWCGGCVDGWVGGGVGGGNDGRRSLE